MKKNKLTILMPALNEEKGISDTIKTIPKKEIGAMGFSIEILVVDGKSKDLTAKVAKKCGARVISSDRGYGRQYKKGLLNSKGDIIITGDSDGTYPFEDIPQYLKYFLDKNLKFATINRFAKLEAGSMHFSNKVGNILLTVFTNLLFGVKLKDSQSGMWIISKDILPKLNLTSDGMPFSQEIKIEAFRKFKSEEIPGFYKKRLGVTKLSKIKDGFGNLLHLFKKRFKLI